MKPDDIRLAYLLISSPAPNIYLGGMMVTDGRGLPTEFRYTEPIQPTRIQQVLYGQVLSNYIKREVILETLLKSVESKFKCLMVEDDSLLAQEGKGFSAVRISETKLASLGEVGTLKSNSATECLMQATREGSPLRLQIAPDKPGEKPGDKLKSLPSESSASSAAGNATAGAVNNSSFPHELLLEASQWMDVHEPLRRVEKALEIICQEAGLLQK